MKKKFFKKCKIETLTGQQKIQVMIKKKKKKEKRERERIKSDYSMKCFLIGNQFLFSFVFLSDKSTPMEVEMIQNVKSLLEWM